MDWVLSEIESMFPWLHYYVSRNLEKHQKAFETVQAMDEPDSLNILALGWNSLLFLMIGYFVLSIIESLAIAHIRVGFKFDVFVRKHLDGLYNNNKRLSKKKKNFTLTFHVYISQESF